MRRSTHFNPKRKPAVWAGFVSVGLVSAGLLAGCASHPPTASLNKAIFASMGTGGSDAPAAKPPAQPTERQRRVAALRERHLGFIRAPLMQFGWVVSDAYDSAFGVSPAKYERMMDASSSADQRRQGINGLVEHDFGQRRPAVTRYEQIAGDGSEDFLVRATALRALNRSRDRAAIGLFVKGLTDHQVAVRLEACKALVHLSDDAAIQPLLTIVVNPAEDRDVRIAAADALHNYRKLEVARTLVDTLADHDFGIAWQARQSLKAITGRDMHYDINAWLAYLTGPSNPLG